MRGLLIRHPWIDMILDEQKAWEIRGGRTACEVGSVSLPVAPGLSSEYATWLIALAP